MEMSGPSVSRHGRTVKRKRWGGLRQQLKLLGLFEIDQQHEFYSLTCMMKEGLSAAVQNNPLRDELCEDDYNFEFTQIHKDFRMDTYAGPVFSSLRRSLGMTEKEYQQSLSSEGCYLQFISNSKSKADFFVTNDKRFFLKTQSKQEVRFLLTNLRIYMEHLEKYPHSLLVKFLGVHRIKIAHQRMKYFIVMQSVFYPDDRIAARYDIKGCEMSRWTDPSPEGSQIIVVLKDLNFEGQFIQLDQQRPWLLRQVEIDTAFLQTLNVLDYSLLLAHQPLHQDELSENLSLGTLIMRTKKSVNAASSPSHAAEEDSALSAGLNCATTQCQTTEMHSGNGGMDSTSLEGDKIEQTSWMGTESANLQELQAQNRRLLPNIKNPLHVIDGSEHRYFIGIIDIFTVYGFKKRLEHWWKRLRYPQQTFSTVSPPAYCHRLCQWVQDHTK
ncbi:phosphatidylinositol 4-phosphate 5-kinase-like protein 1 isoform X1 [Pimephales promelas]|uniref:phosphatidylinositol 4-phosphate 5-kinase-like protein 1 isoform X1 n=1 Tax=Pimephales promelas TaxID=90988 RepID=UPI0019559191|nr:phosphatidylinositol 4-phosphate 5-kinase-like protein 1 isoform X1 [Pimephales promelas]XP_039515855.1 phosphatidylinositol 4-phosphate 5-kinase-like protein 1 isoform X1 [Pimephales promelas]